MVLPADQMGPELTMGARVEANGHYGTIRYVGEIDGYPGIWLGVDWDDANRGKHDGTFNGISYFRASGPKSGSFVKPYKVNVGQSAIAALRSRYGHQENATAEAVHRQQLLSFKQTINAPFLEMVGFEKVFNKIRDFNKLHVVNLSMQNINDAGGPNELRNLCPNITELDISKNLITHWTTVFQLCIQLDRLNWLNVSENKLIMTDEYQQYQCPTVSVLICGQMNLDWSDVIRLHAVFPNCAELRLPANRIATIYIPEAPTWQQLTLLDLEGNPINDWTEILKLSAIATLESLNVENIGIARIWFDGEMTGKTQQFPNLRKIVLTNNFINDWQSIGELNKLQRFEDLKFLKNPILETENYATCVQYIIARIGNLKQLNGAVIKPDERKGAEYDYLKKYGMEWLTVQAHAQKRDQFFVAHNRYEELIEKYGSPEESELKTPSKVIGDSLIEVKIVHGEQTIRKKLPPSLTVQRLILLIQRLIPIADEPQLFYVSQKQPDLQIALAENKELSFYSIESDDTIIIN